MELKYVYILFECTLKCPYNFKSTVYRNADLFYILTKNWKCVVSGTFSLIILLEYTLNCPYNFKCTIYKNADLF